MDGRGVVIAGSGQAGFQAAFSLRENGYDRRIALIGDEPHLPYQRPPLSKAFIADAMPTDALALRPASAYAELAVDLVAGARIATVGGGRVALESGAVLPYDHLILAVGARNRRLAIPGAEHPDVLMLRGLDDAVRLRARMATAAAVAIVGAGFIGLEIAAALSARGCPVTVVELAPRPMARSVSAAIAGHFARRHAERGVRFHFNTGVARITGGPGRVTGIETTDGTVIAADLVVVGAGVIPNTELAAAAGLRVDNGVVVDRQLVTDDPAISAIGDCAAFPDPFDGTRVRLESVQNAVDQARCVAARLVGRPAPYAAIPWFWSDQGPDKLQIAGLTGASDRIVLRGDPDSGSFSAFCFRAGRFRGVESVNRPGDHLVGRRLLGQAVVLTPDQAADPGFDLKAHIAAHQAA